MLLPLGSVFGLPMVDIMVDFRVIIGVVAVGLTSVQGQMLQLCKLGLLGGGSRIRSLQLVLCMHCFVVSRVDVRVGGNVFEDESGVLRRHGESILIMGCVRILHVIVPSNPRWAPFVEWIMDEGFQRSRVTPFIKLSNHGVNVISAEGTFARHVSVDRFLGVVNMAFVSPFRLSRPACTIDGDELLLLTLHNFLVLDIVESPESIE